MVGWILQSEDTNLPDWLKSNLRSMCDCGSAMENYYNDVGSITSRRCSNTNCPYRLAQKIVSMCDVLKVKGIGPERAYALVRDFKIKSQYEAIPHILTEKPTVTLFEFLRMSFIKGVDKGWAEVTEKCVTLDDCFVKYQGKLSYLLNANKELLEGGLQYVNLSIPKRAKYKPILSGVVMLSGTLRGYAERNDFIASLNQTGQGLLDIRVSEGKRKTGVMALIQEKDSPRRGKAECAAQNGIPIYSPDEFRAHIMSRLSELLRSKKVELAE